MYDGHRTIRVCQDGVVARTGAIGASKSVCRPAPRDAPSSLPVDHMARNMNCLRVFEAYPSLSFENLPIASIEASFRVFYW